jgi:hypothetical protein
MRSETIDPQGTKTASGQIGGDRRVKAAPVRIFRTVAVEDVGWQTAYMRIRWRRLLVKSWFVSRWYYRWHGLVLDGRPSDQVWYFAYGSNMHEATFVERRRIRPLESRVGRVSGYRLRFNLEGRPKGKAAPANICIDADQEVWGVLYKIHVETCFAWMRPKGCRVAAIDQRG